jgi:hypothetical protein
VEERCGAREDVFDVRVFLLVLVLARVRVRVRVLRLGLVLCVLLLLFKLVVWLGRLGLGVVFGYGDGLVLLEG